MEETQDNKKIDNHLSSAAAFVEGGIQEACDDACSICLEDFCESDPSTELLEAVERERNIRLAPPRHATIFHHPTLGDFELQHLPVGATDADLEERIIQHLAAAAAMGRAHHHFGRRDGHRGRPSSHNRPHFLVLSAHPSSREGSVALSGDDPEEPVGVSSPSMPIISSSRDGSSRHISVQANQISSSMSGATLVPPMSRQGIAFADRGSVGHHSPPIQDRAGPSDFQSFSESLKSKWNAVSMKYKESISKSTRGWREKFFARNTSMGDLSPQVRREENEEINSITCGMERLEARENTRASITPESSDDTSNVSVLDTINQRNAENQGNIPLTDGNTSISHAAAVSNPILARLAAAGGPVSGDLDTQVVQRAGDCDMGLSNLHPNGGYLRELGQSGRGDELRH
ncbi:hypothetical protein CDL15_Pgr003191 [Punica granatum]|uniref:E3 ubiquitin-protein ligase RHF2A-like n=1 Tax=Punica granatum TaxID=22663 RepID=A0A218X2Y0_PUNGR|nr:hypothetical protein CDL15_Pgr003191 [Punica granatum]